MKTKLIAKTFFLFASLLIFNTAVFAQEKPQAMKFDEFVEGMIGRVNRFAQYVKKDSQSEFCIIYYNPRKSKYGLEGKKWAEYAQGILENGYDISRSRIVLVDGGVRENQSLELWIVPKGADSPKPNPHYNKSEAITCPEISVIGDNFLLARLYPF